MRARRLFVVVTTASCLVAVAVACSDFDADVDEQTDAAPMDSMTEASVFTDRELPDGGPSGIACGSGFLVAGQGDGVVDAGDTTCGDAGGVVKLMTNDLHCGECFHSCGGLTNCVGGVCNPSALVVDADAGASFLGLSGDHLYWSRPAGPNSSEIRRRSLLPGASAETVFVTSDGEVAFAGLTPTKLFLPQPLALAKMLIVANDGGGAPAPVGDTNFQVGAITTAGENAFYTEPEIARVRRARVGGGAPTLVDGEQNLTAIAADDDAVFWLRAANDAGADAAPAGSFTRFDQDGGKIQRAATLGQPVAVAVDRDYAYVFDATTRELRRLDKRVPSGPGELLTTWTGPESTPSGMVVDDANVYMLLGSPTSTRVLALRVSKCGGAPLRLMTLSPVPVLGTIAVDDKWVYVPESGRGIRRAPK